MVRGTTRSLSGCNVPREAGVRLARVGGLLCLVSVALTACALPGHVSAPAAALTDAEAVLAKIAENTVRRERLSVEARVSYYGKEGARKAKAVILARRPADLHFSVYSPTDDMLGVLASDGENFTSFRRGQPHCYAGRSCSENIAQFSFFPMEGRQLVDALVGGVPLIWYRKSSVEWDPSAGAYRVELSGSRKVTQRIWVVHGTWDVRRMEVLREGALEVSIAFDDLRVVAGERLPHTIDMKMPSRDLDLRVRYREVDLNTDIADDAFVIPCPQGTRTQTLLCYEQLPDTQRVRPRVKWARPKQDGSHGK